MTRIAILVAMTGCVPQMVEKIEERAIAEALDVDPRDVCVLEDVDALVEAYPQVLRKDDDGVVLMVTRGAYPMWCDLPGVQSKSKTRRRFLPLESYRTLELELCGYGSQLDDPVCGPPSPDMHVDLEAEWWTCENGRRVHIGWWADWTCEGSNVEGSRDHYARIEWELDW